MADNQSTGVIAMLVIIAVLLIAGFLYYQRDDIGDAGGNEVNIDLPDAPVDLDPEPVPEPAPAN